MRVTSTFPRTAFEYGQRCSVSSISVRRLVAVRKRWQRDQQFDREPVPSRGDRSDADSRRDRRIPDVEAFATSDADHRVLPAGPEPEREELLGVGPGSAVAAHLGRGAEVDHRASRPMSRRDRAVPR